MTARPVTLNGVVYPTRAALAKAWGVHPSTVTRHLARGTPERIGAQRNSGREAIPVAYRGRLFPSMNALARSINRTSSEVSVAWRAGTLDDLQPWPSGVRRRA